MYAQNIKEEIDRFENHENERDGLNGLIRTAKSLHADERIISLLSIRLVGLLAEQNAAVNANMSVRCLVAVRHCRFYCSPPRENSFFRPVPHQSF